MEEAKVELFKDNRLQLSPEGLEFVERTNKRPSVKIQIYRCLCALSVRPYPFTGTVCGRGAGCECIDAWTINSERLDTPALASMGLSSLKCTGTYPLTAWSRRREGKAVRTFTVCRRMRRMAHSTRSSPPLAMKAGIHSTLPLRLCSLWTKRCTHSSLFRSWKARWTTEGFIVTRLVRRPTSAEYSSTGARLHLGNAHTYTYGYVLIVISG